MDTMVKKTLYEEKTIELIEELINECGCADGRAQQRARDALEDIGSPAVGPLIHALLNAENTTIRWRAAEALGHIGDIDAIDPLINALKDKDNSVKWRAIEALADIGQPAIKPLTMAIEDEDEEVRWGAKRALKDIRIRILMETHSRHIDKAGKISRSVPHRN